MDDAVSIASGDNKSYRGAKRSRNHQALDVLGGKVLQPTEGRAKDKNMAVAFLTSDTMDDSLLPAAHALLKLPASVKSKIRIKSTGYGKKIVDCAICRISSNSDDPLLGAYGCFLLWAHLEDDGATIFGRSCWWCVGGVRRRFKGWKFQELVDHLAIAENFSRFQAWRLSDIDFVAKNGWSGQITAHVADGGVDKSK